MVIETLSLYKTDTLEIIYEIQRRVNISIFFENTFSFQIQDQKKKS